MSSGDPKKDKIITLNIPLYVSITCTDDFEFKEAIGRFEGILNVKLCRDNWKFYLGGSGF